jgi:hypothetical protein
VGKRLESELQSVARGLLVLISIGATGGLIDCGTIIGRDATMSCFRKALAALGLTGMIFLAAVSVHADGLVVGTSLDTCVSSCTNANFILPGQFLAQSFTLNDATEVSSIYFTTGVYVAPIDPSNPIQTNYSSLSFDMQLTTMIGSVAMPADTLASFNFNVPDSIPEVAVFSLPVNQTLAAGTYYLVASTNIPIPNSSKILGWPFASTYYPNTGPALGASGEENVNSSIWQEMQGCSQSDCRPNPSVPAASAFELTGGPALPTPFEFQVCSPSDPGDCPQVGLPGPVASPEPGTIVLLLPGLLGLLVGMKRLRQTSLATGT